jgi:hypothetical protein
VEWNWQGEKPKHSEKNCPSSTLSTTYPTWTDLGSNLGLRGGRPLRVTSFLVRYSLILASFDVSCVV